MTNKTVFNAEELYLLWKAPYTTAAAIMIAHPGGLVSEMVASVKSSIQAREIFKSELMQSILAFSQDEANAYSDRVKAETKEGGLTNADDVLAMTISDIRAAVKLLREKAEPTEVHEYQQMILLHAEKVAQAGKEGGFLGIGSVRVTEIEERVLAEIRIAVNRLH